MTQDYPAGHSRMMSLLSHGGAAEADTALIQGRVPLPSIKAERMVPP